jgi:hypothetical protein
MDISKIEKMLAHIREKIGDHIFEKGVSSRAHLEGMCGVCSYTLFKTFKKLGYKPLLHTNTYHCFLTVEGYWIDLTLKQFNPRCPAIYIKKVPYTKDDGYGNVHRKSKTARTIQEIKKMFRGWPDEQNPVKQKLPSIKINRLTIKQIGV